MLLNVLEIGTDRFTSGDLSRQRLLKKRRLEYSKYLKSLTLVLNSCEYTNNGYKSEKEAENIEVHYVYSRARYYLINIMYPFRVFKLCRKICQNKNVDVISAQDPFISGIIAYFLKRKVRASLNIQIHTDIFNNKAWIAGVGGAIYAFIYNIIAKFTIKKADTIRVVSEKLKERLGELGIESSKICIVPTPIDISNFENLDDVKINLLRDKMLQNKFKKIILFIGRLSEEKNISLLIKAFSLVLIQFPEINLLIVGKGDREDTLRKEAESLGISKNVIWAGAVEYSEIPYFYRICDVFVLPSLTEARGSVLVEAALSKKPIIVTNIAGAKDCVIDNRTGFIIDHNNHRQLAEKIIFLLNNPEIAKQFGETGNSFVLENLKINNDIKAVISCWEQMDIIGHQLTK